ncbi:MAG: glycosyltransferase family 2 protein [Haloferacaceae archaeon]
MDLSVVVPTLDGRDHLGATLDALAEHAPTAEVVVANGPSTDGTTGMVRARDDVDVLVEVSDRTVNVARNAGIETTTGDVVALVDHDLVVGESWAGTVRDALTDGADAVTGPARSRVSGGATAEAPERRRIGGRAVTYFEGGNVAFTRASIDALDGFDEYLETGGARDAAHRLAALGRTVDWRTGMSARREYEADGGRTPEERGWKYRSLAYRLVKNYGLRPTVVRRVLAHAGSEAVDGARDVVRGDSVPTAWFGSGRSVVGGIARGTADGLVARARDRTPRHNPNGISRREDRAVARYDWR